VKTESTTQDQVVAASAVEVVLFEDRARVRREAPVSLVAGSQLVRLSGAGLSIDDSSLALSIEGADGIELLSWRVLREVRVAHAQDEARRCREASDAADRAVETARLALGRLIMQRRLLIESEEVVLAEAARLGADGLDGWADAFDGLDAPMTRWLDEEAQARAALEDREREQQRAMERLSDALTERREVEAIIEVQLSAPSACAVTLRVEYVTPCAAWRPAHRAELLTDADGTSGTIALTRLATVWQATGERWERVRCAFSTARPTQAAAPPALADDLLYTRPKTEQEKRVVEVEARDVTIQLTGTVDGTRKADAMPGVDDGGEPLRFEPSRLVTIPSDGKPFIVELDQTTLSCRVELVAFPELAAVAHVRALTTWTGATPLLAGPVTLRREGEVVGTARLKFVGAGDAFELGFGPDEALRVRRSVGQSYDVRGITRRNYIEREVSLHVSNLSARERTLILIERLPVSEIEDVHVKPDAANPAEPDKDGFVRVVQHLPARRYATSTIKYTVDYGSNVNLRL
jgi:uncharacterized protein (TIGR02231 family)